jgi:glutamyl-tRNA synthetase
MIQFLFEDVAPTDKAAKVLEGQGEYLSEVAQRVEKLEKWNAASIEEALRSLAEERGLKPKHAFQPVRAAVTGTLVSPPLFESLEILGREKAVERLRRAAS